MSKTRFHEKLSKLLRIPPWMKVLLHHSKETSQELAYLAFFALMPVWLSSLIHILNGRSVWDFLGDYFYNGEAILISAATIGPLFYIISKQYGKRGDGYVKPFPGSRLFIPSIVGVCVVSAVIIGFRNDEASGRTISRDALWMFSLVISLVSLFVWYSVMIIKNQMETIAPEVMREDTQGFLEDWKNG